MAWQGEEEERGQMIGQNPKAGSSTLFVSGNKNKEFSSQDRDRRERTCESHTKTPGEETNRVLQAELYRIPLAR